MLQLNDNNLTEISEKIEKPKYNRKKTTTSILHIGVGNFHRSHEAFYTDEVLNLGYLKWAICGIGILENDRKMYEILTNQNGLYTLMVTQPDGKLYTRIIGSIVEYLFAPIDKKLIIEKMASPEVKIISLTITEGGYNYDTNNGNFKIDEPDIQWDIDHPDDPKTVFGYLKQALRKRKQRNLPGLAILSCDNIQKNGDTCKRMLGEFIHITDPALMDWIQINCSFPNSMVDRITPVTTSVDVKMIKDRYGYVDAWPVHSEPYVQWILEDKFVQGRPMWESVGVQFVKEVEPYERMKIRLLNAGHSLLGFAGTLQGYTTIDEAVRDPLTKVFLRKFMDVEVTPLLGELLNIDLEDYKDNIIIRFSNQHIKDNLSRICADSSDKIPKFLLPTIREQLSIDGSIVFGTLVIVLWDRYLQLEGTSNYNYAINDPMKGELRDAAKHTIGGDPLSFLKINSIFGDLVQSTRFTDMFLLLSGKLKKAGINHTIEEVITNDSEN